MSVLDASALAALLLLGPLPPSLWNASGCACAPLSLHTALQGAGMHRQLDTTLELSPPGDAAQPACRLLLLQALPRGAAADPDELAAAARSGGPAWRVVGDSGRERPASECSPSVAALEVRATLTAPGPLLLPLHARYPAPCASKPLISTVTLLPPLLLQRCEGDERGGWRPAPPLAEPAALDWAVPCGDAAAEKGVLLVTSFVTVASAAVVLWALAHSQQSRSADRYI